jgi:hypothetical protein
MEPHILLAKINALLSRTPPFDDFVPESSVHHEWLGQAYALVNRWDSVEASDLRLAANFAVSFESTRIGNLATVLATLHRAVAGLELLLPSSSAQAFGPGAQYDFFKALNSVISSAQKSLLIIDPYIDDTIFDGYLSQLPEGVGVRLLVEKCSAKVQPAAQKFVAQYTASLEVRRSKKFHDRVVFVDESECWVLGQSIAHAASSKPTYLAPLSPDITSLKLAHYEDIWRESTAIKLDN